MVCRWASLEGWFCLFELAEAILSHIVTAKLLLQHLIYASSFDPVLVHLALVVLVALTHAPMSGSPMCECVRSDRIASSC